MISKFFLVFFLVLLTLAALKGATDTCLPARTSSFLPLTQNRDNFVCRIMSDWDEKGRIYQARIFSGVSGLTGILEKDSLNPVRVGVGDFLLFWQTSIILPLILELVPKNSVSTIKLLVYATSCSFVFYLVLHYFYLIFLNVASLLNLTNRTPSKKQDKEKLAALMGRNTNTTELQD